jgi:hypothetical protein
MGKICKIQLVAQVSTMLSEHKHEHSPGTLSSFAHGISDNSLKEGIIFLKRFLTSNQNCSTTQLQVQKPVGKNC